MCAVTLCLAPAKLKHQAGNLRVNDHIFATKMLLFCPTPPTLPPVLGEQTQMISNLLLDTAVTKLHNPL